MKKRKKIIIWIIIAVVIAGGVFMFLKSRGSEIKYTTEEASRQDIFQTVSVTGELVSDNHVNLTFETNGNVSSVSVNVGDKVEEGQEIARIDATNQRVQLAQAQEELRIQQENLKLARRGWDNLKPEEKEAKKATVRSAEASVDYARNQLSKTVIYSPIAGTVAKKNVTVGENVTAGSALVSGSTSVATIINGGFEIEANIPESDVVSVQVGQKATITFDALTAEDVFEARVAEIEPAATIIQDVVYYSVKLAIENPDDRLRHGMSVDIDIHTDERKDVLAIPGRAIDKQEGKNIVQVLVGEEQVEEKEVETGLRGDDGYIEITSGLKEGEEIITFTEEK